MKMYNNLLATLSTLNSSVTTYNLEVRLLDIENKISSNLPLLEFWKKHLSNVPDLSEHLFEKQELIDAFAKIE